MSSQSVVSVKAGNGTARAPTSSASTESLLRPKDQCAGSTTGPSLLGSEEVLPPRVPFACAQIFNTANRGKVDL